MVRDDRFCGVTVWWASVKVEGWIYVVHACIFYDKILEENVELSVIKLLIRHSRKCRQYHADDTCLFNR